MPPRARAMRERAALPPAKKTRARGANPAPPPLTMHAPVPRGTHNTSTHTRPCTHLHTPLPLTERAAGNRAGHQVGGVGRPQVGRGRGGGRVRPHQAHRLCGGAPGHAVRGRLLCGRHRARYETDREGNAGGRAQAPCSLSLSLNLIKPLTPSLSSLSLCLFLSLRRPVPLCPAPHAVRHQGVAPQHLLRLGRHMPGHPAGRVVARADAEDGAAVAAIPAGVARAGRPPGRGRRQAVPGGP